MNRDAFVAYMSSNRQHLLRRFGLMSYSIENTSDESLCILANFLNHHRLLGPSDFARAACQTLGWQVRSLDSTGQPARIEFAFNRAEVAATPDQRPQKSLGVALPDDRAVVTPAMVAPPSGVSMTGPEFQALVAQLRRCGSVSIRTKLNLSSSRDRVLDMTCRGSTFSFPCVGTLNEPLSLSLRMFVSVATAVSPTAPQVHLVPDGKNLRIGDDGFLVLGI